MLINCSKVVDALNSTKYFINKTDISKMDLYIARAKLVDALRMLDKIIEQYEESEEKL